MTEQEARRLQRALEMAKLPGLGRARVVYLKWTDAWYLVVTNGYGARITVAEYPVLDMHLERMLDRMEESVVDTIIYPQGVSR